MIGNQELQLLFSIYKVQTLSGRYIHNGHILPLLESLKAKLKIKKIGHSVLQKPIFSLELGYGSKRILIWSQMHGNESTTTKAVFDLVNTLLNDSMGLTDSILEKCHLLIIPILNPDGAEAYTRVNANEIDLNRDSINLSQPESKILRNTFEVFKPDFCFNLHGQRTIFGAGSTNKPATVSFLAPSQDKQRSITESRMKSMEVIVAMNQVLQTEINGQVAVYDDSFNINCVGDSFQMEEVPTILFEAGHYQEDYRREKTREYIYHSLLTSLYYIANNDVTGKNFEDYLKIPKNEKCFYDIIYRNAKLNGKIQDIAIQFEEVLKDKEIKFIKTIKDTGNLKSFFGHKEYEMDKKEIKIKDLGLNNGIEIDLVKKKA